MRGDERDERLSQAESRAKPDAQEDVRDQFGRIHRWMCRRCKVGYAELTTHCVKCGRALPMAVKAGLVDTGGPSDN